MKRERAPAADQTIRHKHLGSYEKKGIFKSRKVFLPNPFLGTSKVFERDFDQAFEKFSIEMGEIYACSGLETYGDFEVLVPTIVEGAPAMVDLSDYTDENFSYYKVIPHKVGVVLARNSNLEEAEVFYLARKSPQGHLLLAQVSLTGKKVSVFLKALDGEGSLDEFLSGRDERICVSKL